MTARSATSAKGIRPRLARRQRRSSTYVLLAGVLVVLNLIGLVMVLSASSVHALRSYGSSWFFFNRQLLWVGLGAVALVAAARFDYRHWRRLAVPLLGVNCVLLLAVLIPGVGLTAGGSTRWLGAGSFRMQPSELVKFAVLLYSADLLTRRADRLDEPALTVRPVGVVLAVIAVLLMKQPDLGTTLVVAGIAVTVLFAGGARLGTLARFAGAGVALTALVARIEPYRWERMTSFLDPWADAGNTGYQAAQGLVALGSGQLVGTGLGASRAKWGFLPAAHTDFIFAIIGEELGLAGTLAVVVLFVALAVLGIRTALHAPDRFGTLLAAGTTAWVVGQALVNIGAVTGLLPITGVPLPFVSAGGSSLVILMTAMGVVLNIANQPASRRRVGAG